MNGEPIISFLKIVSFIFSLCLVRRYVFYIVSYRKHILESSPKKHKPKHEKEQKDKKYTMEKYREKDLQKSEPAPNVGKEMCWMAPLIRVRVVSKDFKQGKYYHKKVCLPFYLPT